MCDDTFDQWNKATKRAKGEGVGQNLKRGGKHYRMGKPSWNGGLRTHCQLWFITENAVWFTHQNSVPLEIGDRMNLTYLVINKKGI